MTKNQTTENDNNVSKFIASITDDSKRNDCLELIKILTKITKLKPKMWGSSIIGFGSHHYKYESGRDGDNANFSFSPRASSIALYLSSNLENRAALLKVFGKHKADKGCVHIKRLSDIDQNVLIQLITNHIKHINEIYPGK